jgi:hypothetical protein
MTDAQAVAAPASRIELVEASGPVPPRHSYKTTITITCEASREAGARLVRDHRDASGEHHDEGTLERARYEQLVADVLGSLPLGAPLDLAAGKRDRKGVSFNHVIVTVGEASTRLDYLLSDLDEDDGDPRARAVVDILKRAALSGHSTRDRD